MPSPEGGFRGPPDPQEPQPAQPAELSQEPGEAGELEPPPYYKASRFVGEKPAGRAYFQAQEVIYNDQECDLSAYRLMLNAIFHVAVLGEQPSPKTDHALTRILSQGKMVPLPTEVLAALNARRVEMKQQGEWVEGHYRPGIRLGEEEETR